jgi:hypothetical protein
MLAHRQYFGEDDNDGTELTLSRTYRRNLPRAVWRQYLN